LNAAREWPQILGFGTGATITESLIEQKYRKLARKYHPDAGGTTDDMTQLNLAKQLALKWVKDERDKLAALQVVARQQEQMFNQAQQINAQMQQQMANMYSDLAGQLGGLGAQNFNAQQSANAQMQQQMANMYSDLAGQLGGLGAQNFNAQQSAKMPAYVMYTPIQPPAKWWQFWKR
jgi:DnaJ-class molecular chaperone